MSASQSMSLREFYDFIMSEENNIIDQNMIQIFSILPSRTELPDYYQAIARPMSFQKILRSLKQYDGDVQAMIKDICQIAYNCRFYNEEGTLYYNTAVKLDNTIKEKIIPKAKAVFHDSLVHWVDFGSAPGETGNANQLNSTFNKEEKRITEDFKKEDKTKSIKLSEEEKKLPTELISTQSKPITSEIRHQEFNSSALNNSQLSGFDNGSGIFKSNDGKEYITSPDVTRNFTKVPVGSKERFPQYIQDRIFRYEGQNFSGMSEHQTRKKGRPAIKPLLETRFLQFLNDEKIMENSLLDHKAPFVFDGGVKTFEQIKFNIKRGFISSVGELKLALKEVCDYQVTHSFKQNHEAIKSFTDRVLDRAYVFFSGFNNLKEESEKITVDRIEYNGIVYEIGSFVLLKNTNDETRPIPAQIFQIWREAHDHSLWMSCSWYLRPEQTVHRADRLFYKNEVVKSTQSRIHRIEDILGMCSIVHFTRFVRAEPLDTVQPMFICEYRYNDSSYKFNKIRTWKGAVPDAVKDLEEYDVPLPQPRFLKKFESPLKHLLDPSLSLNVSRPPESLPTLQSTKDTEQPSLGNIYRDCILERDELGEYSTSLKYTQRHLLLPQHFHMIPSNVRFDPVSESFIDSSNVLNKMVLAIYGTGLQNFNTPSLEHLSRMNLTKSLPQAHNSNARLATLNSFGNTQAGGPLSLANKDISGTGTLGHLSSRSAMTRALLNAADKKKSKYNKLSSKADSSALQQNNKVASQTVKPENVYTKSHYLDVLLLKNRLSKSIPAFLADEKSIDPAHRYLLGEPQSFVLNEPILDHIEGFRRTTSEINERVAEDIDRYNSTILNKNDHVILYNNSNLKNETEKMLQDIKIAEIKRKEEEEILAVAKQQEDINSDDEIDNLYLSKNQRKRKNSDLSSDGSFIDSELSEGEILERSAYKKLQKLDHSENEEDTLMEKYCKMVSGVRKGDVIWFRGMGAAIIKRVIDPKDPLNVTSVGPSLEYLQYRMKKDKLRK